MKTIQELIPLIENWAKEKGLLVPENTPKQYLKFLEEVGETAHEILHENWDKAKLEFGDIAVTAIIISKQLKIELHPAISKFDNTVGFELVVRYISSTTINKFFLFELSRLALGYKLDLTECLNLAWDKIKDRTGKTENGTFIKDNLPETCIVKNKEHCFMAHKCKECEFTTV